MSSILYTFDGSRVERTLTVRLVRVDERHASKSDCDNTALSDEDATANDAGAEHNQQFAILLRQLIRRFGLRVCSADPAALAELVSLQDAVANAVDEAVAGLRDAGVSWTEIGLALGITRQAARQRWLTVVPR
ncbi:hypothetical protein ACWDYH_14890 [Nocardia goodfellowii]